MEKVDLYGFSDNKTPNMEAGLVTWWTLKGGTYVDKLRDELAAAGLPEEFKPDPVGAGTALWKAVTGGVFSTAPYLGAPGEQYSLIIRKLPKERSSWAVVMETIDGKRGKANLNYETLMKIWLDNGDSPTYCKAEPEDTSFQGTASYDFDAWFDNSVENVDRAFEYNRANLDAREMSNWLIHVLQNCIHGIRLRQRGGIYYVPPDRRDMWEEVVTIIDNVGSSTGKPWSGTQFSNSHTVYTMPVVKSDQVTQAVLDALSTDVNACVAKIEFALEEGIKERAIRNRKVQALALDAKLEAYRSLLGGGINVLEDKIMDLKASIAELELTCES